MKTVNKYKTLANASDSFSKAKYEQALRNYALVLKDYPNSQEAYNGAILSEMAMSGEASAIALFDYYEVLKDEDSEQADTIIREILNSLDGTMDELSQMLNEPFKNQVEFENGISYEDFKLLVEEDGDFKKIFVNIMFSTRVIISEKDDFLDFLQQLIQNGFQEMALSYVDSALSVYKNDPKLMEIFNNITLEAL